MSTVDMDRLPEFAMEARRIGLTVLPPDVSYCQGGFSCQGITVRYGLLAIPKVGEAAVRKITAAQPYGSWDDYLARSGADAGVTYALAKAGALDNLVPTRKGLLRVIESDRDGSAVRCVHKTDEANGPGGLPCSYDWEADQREQEERHAALMAPRLAEGRKPLKLALKLPPARCTRACRRYTPPSSVDMAAWGEYPPDALFRSDMAAYGTWMSDAVFGRLDKLSPGLREQAREMGRVLVTAAPGTYPVAAVVADVHSAVTKNGSAMWWVKLMTEASVLDLACFSPLRDGDLDVPAMVRFLRPGTLVEARVRKRTYMSKSGPRMGWNLLAVYPLGA
jgi:DNA polymerase-3 subunit alpha